MTTDLEKIDDDSTKTKKIEKMKEQLLDETFKKAEISKKSKKLLLKEKKDLQKFFPIFGLIFIFISIAGFFIINYLPWMYIKYNNSDLIEIEGFVYRDFKTKIGNKEIFDLMGASYNNNSNSNNYIGLSTEDFIFSPKYSYYGFIALILFGIFSIIFAIIDKFHGFTIKTAILFYSISSISELIIGVFILLLCLRFLGANFLLFYNKALIENTGLYNVKLLILAPILLIVFAFIIIKCAQIDLNLNFKELQKRSQSDKTSKLFSTYKYGSSI